MCIAAAVLYTMVPGTPVTETAAPMIPDLVADFTKMLADYTEKVPTIDLKTVVDIKSSVSYASKDPMSLPFKQLSFKQLIELVPFLDKETQILAWNYLTSLAMENKINTGKVIQWYKTFHEEIGNKIGEALYKSEPANELPESKSRFWKTVFVGVGFFTVFVIPPLIKAIGLTC